MKLVKEFKEFINRGNALELAIGVVIGGAFSAIVNSIVNDLIMPLVSYVTGGFKLSERIWILKQGVDDASTIAIRYGSFVQAIINFLIIGFVIFMVVKTMNSMRRKEETVPDPEPVISEEVLLLREIRDQLKK